MRMRIKIGDVELGAELFDNATAHDFASLLPLTVRADDLMNREKYAHLPRALSTDGIMSHSFEIGDIAYWSPSQDVAFFYRDDGQAIPDPGVIKIGRFEDGSEVFVLKASISLELSLDLQHR